MNAPRTPAKRGPKPKPAEKKPAQLTIRMAPKLKLGLELLARAQHRSLSQAVEWAIQVGLNNYEVGRNHESLGQLVADAWKHSHPARRLLEIYRASPSLLSFEDASACELTEKSADMAQIHEQIYRGSPDADAAHDEQMLDRIYWRVIFHHWEAIHAIAAERALAGSSMAGVFLADLIGLTSRYGKSSGIYAMYEAESDRIGA